MEVGRNQLKVKIFFDRQTLVIYLLETISLDSFYGKIREACRITSNQPITVKWIDNEGEILLSLSGLRDYVLRFFKIKIVLVRL